MATKKMTDEEKRAAIDKAAREWDEDGQTYDEGAEFARLCSTLRGTL